MANRNKAKKLRKIDETPESDSKLSLWLAKFYDGDVYREVYLVAHNIINAQNLAMHIREKGERTIMIRMEQEHIAVDTRVG